MNKVDGVQQLKIVYSSLYSLLHEMFFECLLQLLRWCSGKEYTCKCRRCKRWGFNPWVGKIPWRRKWQPTPVFWPGEFQGQRNLGVHGSMGSLESQSPLSHKESDATEWLNKEQCKLGKGSVSFTFLILEPNVLNDSLGFNSFRLLCGHTGIVRSVCMLSHAVCNPMDCSTPGSSILHHLHQSLLRFMSIELVMLSNHPIFNISCLTLGKNKIIRGWEMLCR